MVELLFATSRGLFVCGLAADGEIEMHDEDVFLKGRPVSSANVLSGDKILVTYKYEYEDYVIGGADEEGAEAQEEELTNIKSTKIAKIDDVANPSDVDPTAELDQKADVLVYAVVKVPGTADGVLFYLMDQSSGLSLIDAGRSQVRQYALSSEEESKEISFRRAKTLAIAPLGATKIDGFRVLKLDTTGPQFKLMAFDFPAEYLKKLNELSGSKA